MDLIQDPVNLGSIASSGNATLHFIVGGGAEIPHFKLRLSLSCPRSLERLILTAIWTAWSDRGSYHPRSVNNLPNTPSEQHRYTFSHRLQNVTVRSAHLTDETAPLCRGTPGDPCWCISWDFKEPPYCFNFEISEVQRRRLTDNQRDKLQEFCRIARSRPRIRIVTQKRGSFLSNWKLMTAMPVPTPPPFPNYDCRYYDLEKRLQPISLIPTIEGKRVVIDHYGQRRRDSFSTYGAKRIICDGDQLAPLRFVNERHYEAVKIIGACREMDHLETLAYRRDQHQTYTFRFDRLSLVHDDWENTPLGFHYCLIDMRLQSGKDLLGASEFELPPPSLGSPVEITITAPSWGRYLTFQGVTVRPPGQYHEAVVSMANPVCMLVFCGQFPVISPEFPGKVTIRPSRLLHYQAHSSLQSILYGVGRSSIYPGNVLTRLLLAHDTLFSDSPSSWGVISLASAGYIARLKRGNHINRRQISAMTLALTSIPILIAGSSHCCLYVLEDMMNDIPDEIGRISADGVYRLDSELGDDLERQMAAGGEHRRFWQTDLYTREMIDELYLKTYSWDSFLPLWAWIEARTSSDSRFSMGRHINRQLLKYCAKGPRWRAAYPADEPEIFLLADVIIWYCASIREGCFHDEPLGEYYDEPSLKNRLDFGFRAALAMLERFYILRATVILCTTATPASHVLWGFNPQFILVENASSMTETVCLNAIARHYASASKIILTGDPNQSPTLVTSWGRNEYLESAKLSLLTRLLRSHVPSVELRTQYRMAPELGRLITDRFYDAGSLETGPNTENRQAAILFKAIMGPLATGCDPGNLYFISVQQSSLWRRKHTLSYFNPEFVCCMIETVQQLINDGIHGEQILILSDYAEERSALRQLLRATHTLEADKIEIQDIDSSSGKQKEVVILSTGRPAHMGTGSTGDSRRRCLALSRAMDGLIIIGHSRMGSDDSDDTRGSNNTGFRIVRRLDTERKVITVPGDRKLLEKHLGVPNERDYEELMDQHTELLDRD